jgi:hypothetical protein
MQLFFKKIFQKQKRAIFSPTTGENIAKKISDGRTSVAFKVIM